MMIRVTVKERAEGNSGDSLYKQGKADKKFRGYLSWLDA